MSDESSVKTFEDWAELEKAESWLVASARSAFRIPFGREMTREAFQELLRKTGGLQMLPAPKTAEQKAEEAKAVSFRESPQAPTPNEIPEP